MQTYINNSINGFFILTPHFDENRKIICVYNKFDENKKLEFVVDEEIYHVEENIYKTGYVLNTYNNNLIITGKILKNGDSNNTLNKYHIFIYYCYDPEVHINIKSFPGNYKKLQICAENISNININYIINYVYKFIINKMYYPAQFSNHKKELKDLILNMFLKIGLIDQDKLNIINKEDNNFEKFNRNN